MSENTENVKRVRDLEDFDPAVPLSDQDYLIVATNEDANNDGTNERVPLTKKAKISEAVQAVNRAVAAKRESQPETIEIVDENGNNTTIPNPLKNITTEVDGNGVEVDITPVTAENLDGLVDPGSGLEVKTICRNEDFEVVDCGDPSVKYKTKKLSLATSEESKTITIHVNTNDGVEYEKSGKALINGALSEKFKRLRDAFQYIQNDIGDSDTTINIHIETDTDEGEINHVNNVYHTRKNAEINGCYIYIYGSDAQWRQGANPPKVKIKTKNLPSTNNAYVPFWFNAYQIRINFVHFCTDLDDNKNIHTCFRAHKNCLLEFFGCKFSVRGSTHIYIEASRGATVEIQNKSDGINDLDYRDKNFWEPAIEFDFHDRGSAATSGPAVAGDPFYCNYLFAADTGGVFRFPEYGSHIPYSDTQKTNFQSRIHFCSDKVAIGAALFGVEGNCVMDIVGLFTTSLNENFTATKIPYFLRASAFNAIGIKTAYQPGGTVANGYGEVFASNGVVPGNVFVNPTTQYDIAVKEDVDYVKQSGVSQSLTLITKVKMTPNDSAETDLENYWDPHNF